MKRAAAYCRVSGDHKDATVAVRRQWNDYRQAVCRLKDVEGLKWDNFSGGSYTKSPGYFLHGYVQCDMMITGELSHSGIHGPCPHRIKICITKVDNDPSTYRFLVDQVGPKPTKSKE